jgi:hypothetical protein
MKKTILFLLLLTFFTNTIAQIDEPEGTIETLTGETINCKIRYSNWSVNPLFIEVIQNDNLKRYYPNEIRGFTVNKLRYVTSVVSFYKGTLEMSMLPENYSEERTSETVFLKLLVSGKYSLYTLRNESRDYYFIQKPDDVPVELVYRLKMKNRLLGEDKTYQSQLAALAENEAKPSPFVENAYSLNYEANELMKYVQRINGNNTTAANDRSEKLYVNFEAGAGVIVPNFIAKGEAIVAPINTISAETVVAPVISAGLVLSRNPQFSYSRFLINFSLVSFAVKGQSATINTPGINYYEQYNFRVSQFNTGLGMVQLLKSARKMKVYAGGLVNGGFMLSTPGDTKLINTSDGSIYATYTKYPALRKIGVSAILSVGIIDGRFRSELFYQTPFRIAAQNKSNFSATGFGFSIKYALKKY